MTARNRSGETPLHQVHISNSPEAARALIRAGADVRQFLRDLTFSFESRSYWSATRYTGIDVPTKGNMANYFFAGLWVKLGD